MRKSHERDAFQLNIMKTIKTTLAAVGAGFFAIGALAQDAAIDWTDMTISPVLNPVFFEDPTIRTEVRPIFIHHNISRGFPSAFPLGGGDVQLYAAQIRWALTDRFAIIARKDGYVTGDLGILNSATGNNRYSGFADLQAGVKYAVIDDKENQLIVTPGITLELPTGNQEVFQGHGRGEWDMFVSAAKGYNKFHLTGNAGLRLPNDMSKNTAQLHYSLQLDNYVHKYFIPFVAWNAFTTLNSTGAGTAVNHQGLAAALPFNTEGTDLINFGSSQAAGKTQMTLGLGFRSRIMDNAYVGFGWEKATGVGESIFDDRFTFDVIYRF